MSLSPGLFEKVTLFEKERKNLWISTDREKKTANVAAAVAGAINETSPEILSNNKIQYRRHDTQYNDTQHNDTQHNNTQHNDTQHNATQHNDTL